MIKSVQITIYCGVVTAKQKANNEKVSQHY